MKKLSNYIWVLLTGLLLSCSTPKLDPQSYSAWLKAPGNVLAKTKAGAQGNYVLQVIPPEFSIYQKYKKEIKSQEDLIAKDKDNHQVQIILKTPLKVMDDGTEPTSFYISQGRHLLWMVSDEDTLTALDYLFEPSFGIKDYSTHIYTFDDEFFNHPKSQISFIYNNSINQAELILFPFSKNEFEEVPQLKID